MKARTSPEAIERAREDALLAELEALYREVDARHAGWSCDASTTCCRFGLTGREPYVTGIELSAVRRAVARSGRKLALEAPAARGRRRGLPVVDDGERRCPLLGDDGRCSIYASRPFGCRTFFCDRATPGDAVTQRDVNAFVARIRAIAARLAPGAEDGRPLVRALRGPA
jgi:Fe-S-cluster containining protein